MISGIYKFTFKDGSFYIGKSSNIEKRWKQHEKGMRDGTHTKKIQEAYNKFGEPEYELIFESHPDHIDILESIFIISEWGSSKLLNTTKPTADDFSKYSGVPPELWRVSTAAHMHRILELEKSLDNTLREVDRQRKRKTTKELQDMTNMFETLSEKYARLKNRSWFDRLFNIGE